MHKNSIYFQLFILAFLFYSCNEDFVSRDFPSVITISVSLDKDGSIVFTGKLVSRGTETMDEVGFVWQSGGEPDIETGFKANLSEKVKTGLFQLKVFTSIKKEVEYNVRAYAVKDGITIYGDTWVFESPEDYLPPAFSLRNKSGHVGDTIEIAGGLFNKTLSKNSVSINSLIAEVVEVKDSSLLCVVPMSLTSKESTVTVTCEGFTTTLQEKYQLVTPTIASFSSEIVQFLDTMTIYGTGFHSSNSLNVVKFGSFQGVVISSTPGSLVVKVPFTMDTLCHVSVAVSGQSAISQSKIKIILPAFDYFAPTFARHLDTVIISCKNLNPDLITSVFFDTYSSQITKKIDNKVSIVVPVQLNKKFSNLKIQFTGGEYIFSEPFVLLQPIIVRVSDTRITNFDKITVYGQNYNPLPANNKMAFRNISNNNIYLLNPFFSTYDSLKIEIKNYQNPGKTLPASSYQIGVQTCEEIIWSDIYIDIVDMWRRLADFPGGARYKGTSFTINGKGYAGLGTKLGNDLQKDLWEFNPVTEIWTRKSDLPGPARILPVTFVNSEAGFAGGGQDYDNSSIHQPYFDFYKYTPSNDTWAKLSNLPVMQKSFVPSSGSIGDNSHYALLGQGSLHKYDNTTGSWSQVLTGDGTYNNAACHFTINGKIYFVSGTQPATNGSNNQVWEYNPLNNTMTRKNDFPGLSRYGAFSFSIGNYGYIGGGVHYVTNEPSPQCLFDVFRYDPDDDKWTLIGLFPGDYNKMYCYSFVIGTKAYLIGGMDYCNPTLHNDVWEFTDEFDLRKSR